MKKTILLTVLLSILLMAPLLDAQELTAAGYIIENDYGKVTYIFADNEINARIFYNAMKKLYDDSDLFFLESDNPSEQVQQLIDIFILLFDQFYYDLDNKPETFTVVADVLESQITEHQVRILSIDTVDVVTEFGIFDHLQFVFVSSSEDAALFCNVGN